MSSKIVHRGVVDSMADGIVRVRIMQPAACGSCKIAAHCNIPGAGSEARGARLIDVPMIRGRDYTSFHVGDEVTVAASEQMGRQAVVLAFVVPFLVLVAVVFAVSRFTDSEPTMALAGLFSLIPYYIVLYAFRRKIAEKISFDLLIN